MSASETSSSLITRRRLVVTAAAGGSALVLTACGKESDPNADKSDTELLGEILAAQTVVADLYGKGVEIVGVPFAKQCDSLVEELTAAISDLEGDSESQTPASSVDASDPELAENMLIGIANQLVPDLDNESLRELTYRVAAASAGRLALFVNGSGGGDPVPDAFVLGEDPK